MAILSELMDLIARFEWRTNSEERKMSERKPQKFGKTYEAFPPEVFKKWKEMQNKGNLSNRKPHKHAEVIKAWADGAKIQYKNMCGDWIDVTDPDWYFSDEYRVKLEQEEIPVVKNLRYEFARAFLGKQPASASQIGGDHYKAKSIQPWDYIVANNLGYLEGNVVKYVSRYKEKGGVEDLKKAMHYLQKLIETEGAK